MNRQPASRSHLSATCNAVRGFTLVELMVVLAIMAVMVGAAAPAMASWMDSVRRTALVESFVNDLWFTRSEAVRRNARAAMCRSSDGERCAEQGDWSQGWIVFEDRDENGTLGDDEPLIAQRSGLPVGWRLFGNATVARHVTYTELGVTKHPSGAFQAGTLTLCRASDGAAEAVRVVINSLGRPRTVRVTVSSC
jgi:type IV fimbrial biogenesis protein FimT